MPPYDADFGFSTITQEDQLGGNSGGAASGGD
jgi:hypothetical protein